MLFPYKKIPWGASVVFSKKCVITSLTSTTETTTEYVFRSVVVEPLVVLP